jgi:hypothetical protein
MSNELVPVELSRRDLAECRLYPHIKTTAQAAVVFAKAKNLGLCPTIVAESLYFVGGKPAFSAQFIAILLKRSGKYDYRVREKTDKVCKIEFFQGKESLGVEVFTIEMAIRARLAGGDNWKKFPEAMLWARCLTAGVRARCPDALGGNPAYCVEELSPTTPVDEEGRPMATGDIEIIDVTPEPEPPAPAPQDPSPALLLELGRLVKEAAVSLPKFLSYYKVKELGEMTAEQMNHAINVLNIRKGSQ